MKCPHCQTENSEKAKFRKKCGKLLQTEMVCNHCQHRNSSDSEFCEECGQPLASKVPESTANPITPPVSPLPQAQPTSFANGRHQVKKFLGRSGKKKVYLVHDTILDRESALPL